jgi:hypothetical protein
MGVAAVTPVPEMIILIVLATFLAFAYTALIIFLAK